MLVAAEEAIRAHGRGTSALPSVGAYGSVLVPGRDAIAASAGARDDPRSMTRRRRHPLTAATALAAAALACGGAAATAAAAAFEPGEVLVRFRGRAGRAHVRASTAGRRARGGAALRRDPAVRWAVPNYIAHASGAGWIPDDRGRKTFPEGGWQELQWHFLPCGNACDDGSGIARVVRGHRRTRGVAEPDPARAPRRPRRQSRGGGHRRRVPGPRQEVRAQPRPQEPPVQGREDFVDRDKVALDENGHGTHVASTIGERTNGKFVTGLAYGAKLIPVRVLDESGSGKASQVAKGIRWAYRHGADVINLSLEFPRGAVKECADVPSVCAAIAEAHAKGAVVVAAAGNPPAAPGRSSPTRRWRRT